MNPFESLSDKQKEIVFEKEGKFVVRACPGSGKTYSVAARFARLLKDWKFSHQGIAVISFTNVAWQEIESYLHNIFNIHTPIQHPHFLGTIDSFINNHIFLPFGHLMLGCDRRPILVGEPHGVWSGRYFSDSFFDKISFDLNGGIIAQNPREMPRNWQSNSYIIGAKNRLLKAGYANQSDANYFSKKILEEFAGISKSLALKFPFLIVDEAQDTSEIQMNIIDHLISLGLSEVMLVGDYDQAIFEWNEAKPELLKSKYEEWKDNSLVLNDNWRSSQLICDFTFPLSSLEEASKAVNDEVSHFTTMPKIVVNENIEETINKFLEDCRANGVEISRDKVAVLCRSQSFLNEIVGSQNIDYRNQPWEVGKNYAKQFALGKYLIDNYNINDGYKLIEKAVYKAKFNKNYCSRENIKNLIEKYGIINFRSDIYRLVQVLPDTDDKNLNWWIEHTNTNFESRNIPIELEVNQKKGNVSFDDLFKTAKETPSDLNYRVGTVHSVKGETLDAVLLFLKKRGVGKYYKTFLREGASTNDNEELRIVYVAITRPRKILTMAVPDKQNLEAWSKKLFE